MKIDPVVGAVKAVVPARVEASGPVKLTGAEVHGYRLSGWRKDKGGWYRMWIALESRPPIVAASLRHGVYLAVPSMTAGVIRLGRTAEVSLIPGKKASADAWLAETIKAVKERDHG